MQQWQQWMRAGQQAYQQQDWCAAIHCYDAALADVWPVWWQSTFVCPQANCHSTAADWTLPTRCLVTTVRNLAWCYRCNAQPTLAQALLQQTQSWLHAALQQQRLPDNMVAVLLQQHADLLHDFWPSCRPVSHSLH